MPRSTSTKSSAPVVLRNPYSSVANTSSPAPASPTFGQTLKEGFAFGTGSAFAHRLFNPFPTSVSSASVSVPQNKKPCEAEQQAFEKCLKTQSMDTYCGNEQLAYTSCIQITDKH